MVQINTMDNKFYVALYKNRFILLYTIFGFLSLLLENFLRNYFIRFLDMAIANFLSISLGIGFAYLMNIRYNFKVPKHRFKISMVYFVIVSGFSLMLQVFIGNIASLNFIQNRFILSGACFVIAYLLHKKFTFKDYQKTGVAIHLNSKNNVDEIYEKIGNYPDFIHLDLIDETFNESNISTEIEKIKQVQSLWPNKKIQLHIMSNNPIYWIHQVQKFELELFFHFESHDQLQKLVQDYKNLNLGVVIDLNTKRKDILEIVNFVNNIMVLCIDQPGISGQKFSEEVKNIIDYLIDITKNKDNRIILDGGLTPQIVSRFNVHEVISASSILMSKNSPLKLIDFQTSNKYTQ